MKCERCGSENVVVQAVAENKKRGCLTSLLMIILLFIPILGWITLFLLLRGKKSKTITHTVCQNCGYRWIPKISAIPVDRIASTENEGVKNARGKMLYDFLQNAGFSESKVLNVRNAYISVDDTTKRCIFYTAEMPGPIIYKFSDILDYEIYENNETLQVRVSVNNLQNPEIVINMIEPHTDKASNIYQDAIENAKQIKATLNYIANNAQPASI